MRIYNYKCPTCGSTKELHMKSNEEPINKVPCGWRGCMDYAVMEKE